jgi:NAD(P)H-hydrate repair Nnr-like enzyme with NAD(P)H-hydrate epimerase domain
MERPILTDSAETWAIHACCQSVVAKFVEETDTVLDAACGIGFRRSIRPGE